MDKPFPDEYVKVLDRVVEKLPEKEKFHRDRSKVISERLAVWLVVGNLAPVTILLNNATSKLDTPSITHDLVAPTILFVTGASCAFFGMWVNSLSAYLVSKKFDRLDEGTVQLQAMHKNFAQVYELADNEEKLEDKKELADAATNSYQNLKSLLDELGPIAKVKWYERMARFGALPLYFTSAVLFWLAFWKIVQVF